ncbi:alpha/beta fold hydrolase [bacterium]|nr:alpha/beta fold hydrolase [bacterium]
MALSRLAPVRALLRVEVRQWRRHPGRALLVALLIAVPVAAVVGGATLARITEPTARERRVAEVGRADLRVDVANADQLATIQALLPPDALRERIFVGRERVTAHGRRRQAGVVALGPAGLASDGLAAGMVTLESGRHPAHPGEVALSPALLQSLGVAPGDTVALAYGPRRVICGVVVDPGNRPRPLVLRTPSVVEHGGRESWLVGAAGPALADSLRAHGIRVVTADEAAVADEGLTALVFALGAIGFLEAALVVAATFAVGLRRRRREIGLLGANGASPGAIAVAMLLSGLALTAVGTLAGTVLGLGGAAAVHPWLDQWNGRSNGPFEVPVTAIGAAWALGLFTAVAGSWWPVRAVASLPVREALGARRPPGDRPRAWLVAGVALLGASVAVLWLVPRDHLVTGIVAVVGAPLLGLLGFGACSPWILHALARLARPLPLGPRLAIRDAGRFRDRNGPVVTAILAGMAMSVTLAILLTSLEATLADRPRPLRTDHLLVAGPAAEAAVARLDSTFAVVAAAPLEAVYAHGEPVRAVGPDRAEPRPGLWIACGTDDLLEVLGIRGAAGAFAAGELIAVGAETASLPDELTLTMWREGAEVGRRPVHRTRPGERVSAPPQVIARGALADLGLTAGPPLDRSLVPWLVRLDAPVTPRVLDRARIALADLTTTTLDARILHQRPVRTWYHVVLAICVVTGLVIVALATALSAAEAAGDAHVLRTVGAAPGLLRTVLATRSAYLALLGCVLAVPAGLIPALSLLAMADIPLSFVMMPWRDVALTVLGLPALAYAATWLAARRPGPPPRAWSLLPLLLLTLLRPGSLASAGTIAWQPHMGDAFDGRPLAAELGWLSVPENRDDPGSRTIELAVVRYRTANPHPGPPIVLLAGGPGGSGVDLAGPVATHPQLRLLEHADVIGLDQRGTGRSRPDLMADAARIALPLDRPVDRQDVVDAVRRATASMAAAWRARGVDLAGYTTTASADDVDDLRRALDVPRLVTFGTSYGTHLALAHLRRHPGTVARAVLRKVEGPDDTFKRPADTQRQLARLHAEVAAHPAFESDLLDQVSRLLDDLASSPRAATAHAGTDSATTVVVGAHDLRIMLAEALPDSRTRANLPATIARLADGDLTALAASALAHRRFELPLLPVLIDCASGATPARRAVIAAQRAHADNLLADALQWPLYLEACAGPGAGDVGASMRTPPVSDVPVLMISGSLDARTPPANAEALLPGLTAAAHVVVENAGHESRELMSPELRDLMQAFLRGERVSGCTIVLPPVPLARP